jgi:hypothetical protein
MLFPAVLQTDVDYAASNLVSMSANVDCADLPDFSADEGYFYTIQAESSCAQSYNERLVSAVGNSLKLSIGPDSNEGALFAELGVIAKESTINAANATGTNVVPSMSTLFKWDSIDTFTVGGTNYLASFYEMEATITNAAKPVPNGGGSNIALPKFEGSGSFKIAGNDSNILTLVNSCGSSIPGTAKELILQWGDGTVSEAGELNIQMDIQLNNYSIDNSEEITYTFEFTMTQKTVGATPFKLDVWV